MGDNELSSSTQIHLLSQMHPSLIYLIFVMYLLSHRHLIFAIFLLSQMYSSPWYIRYLWCIHYLIGIWYLSYIYYLRCIRHPDISVICDISIISQAFGVCNIFIAQDTSVIPIYLGNIYHSRGIYHSDMFIVSRTPIISYLEGTFFLWKKKKIAAFIILIYICYIRSIHYLGCICCSKHTRYSNIFVILGAFVAPNTPATLIYLLSQVYPLSGTRFCDFVSK